MSAYIVDTETTGDDLLPEAIELAVGKVSAGDWNYTPVFQGYFKPTGKIHPRAMAVHHILPFELEGSPDSALAKAHLPADMEYMIGHKVDYDWEVLGKPNTKRICTLAMAQFVWPGNVGHSIGALTYSLSTDLALARDMLKHAHSAGDDVELCYAILRSLLEQPECSKIRSFEDLWMFSQEARVPKIWTFGKHKDKLIGDAPADYLSWCLKQDFIDDYVKVACRRALGPRAQR